MGKEPKVHFKEQFNFETHLSGGENWINFVDQGRSTAVMTSYSVNFYK